jgi:hypothetical protein
MGKTRDQVEGDVARGGLGPGDAGLRGRGGRREVPTTGEYALDVFGASGGGSAGGGVGGLGAEVSGDISLTAGETLTLFVGGRGQSIFIGGGGGGGGGFVFLGASVLAVAGGGGGGGDAVGGGAGYGGGGGSYLASLFANPILTAGVNSGDGSIDIELLKAVPEPSTWAMTLAGFAGLGWLASRRRRKLGPA